MKNKAIIKLTVSTQGYIRACKSETDLYSFFEKGKHIADNVHINDKIALMTLLDNVRIGKKDNNRYLFRFVNQEGIFVNFYIENAYIDACGIVMNCYLAEESQLSLMKTSRQYPKHSLHMQVSNHLPPLAIVAHEMREPLNAIIGFTDLLLYEFSAEFSDDKQRQYASHIKESGQHLLSLIETYLEQQNCTDDTQWQDIDSGIVSSIAMTTHITKGRKVVFTPDSKSPCFSVLKHTELKQVLINLITNAAKYSDENSIITIQRRVLKNNSLLLTVSDTGMGIAADEIPEMRQPFKRAINALSAKIDGKGIGLSLVFDIVESVKGTVAISSKKNSGTTISITLPLSHATQTTAGIGHKKNGTEFFRSAMAHRQSQSAKLREKYINNGSKKEKIDKSA